MRRWHFFNRPQKRGRFARPSRRPIITGFNSGNPKATKLPKLERIIIRAVTLCAVFLVVAQMGLGLATNPVDYYISIAQNIEAPSLDSTPVSSTITPNLIQESTLASQTVQITLKAIPAAPVRVIQNGKVLGTLARGELEIPVQPGTLQLDGTNVSAIVRIQVVGKDPALIEPRINQTFIIEHNVQTLRISR